MTTGLDVERLGRQLQERLGLALTVQDETVDGGVFSTLRPSDLEKGNGFAVVVARTPRQIEASFRADQYAAPLIKKMWDTDEEAWGTFHVLLAQAKSEGGEVYLAVDGHSVDQLPRSREPWRHLEIDVSRRIGSAKVTGERLLESALSVCSTCISLALTLLPLEAVSASGHEEVQGLPEGAKIRVEVNRYERSPGNRAACIAHYGPVCRACDFDFKRSYGRLGEGYIEVHHRIPVSQLGEGYFVNPVTDLVPVCGNCHAMLHRSNPPMSVEALREVRRLASVAQE